VQVTSTATLTCHLEKGIYILYVHVYIYTVKDRFFRIVGISYNIFKCLVQISYNI